MQHTLKTCIEVLRTLWIGFESVVHVAQGMTGDDQGYLIRLGWKVFERPEGTAFVLGILDVVNDLHDARACIQSGLRRLHRWEWTGCWLAMTLSKVLRGGGNGGRWATVSRGKDREGQGESYAFS